MNSLVHGKYSWLYMLMICAVITSLGKMLHAKETINAAEEGANESVVIPGGADFHIRHWDIGQEAVYRVTSTTNGVTTQTSWKIWRIVGREDAGGKIFYKIETVEKSEPDDPKEKKVTQRWLHPLVPVNFMIVAAQALSVDIAKKIVQYGESFPWDLELADHQSVLTYDPRSLSKLPEQEIVILSQKLKCVGYKKTSSSKSCGTKFVTEYDVYGCPKVPIYGIVKSVFKYWPVSHDGNAIAVHTELVKFSNDGTKSEIVLKPSFLPLSFQKAVKINCGIGGQ